MSCCVIAGLVLLLSATSVVGTGDGDDSTTECVSHEELAAVERRVDQLHSQLHYWQNVTVNILNDHCFPINTGPASSMETGNTVLMSTIFNISHTNNDIIVAYLESINQTLHQQLKDSNEPRHSYEIGEFFNPAHNCSHILHYSLQAASGYYWLQSSPGYAVKVYCDMERVCGCDGGSGEGGGWIRVAEINMARPHENCPAGFRKVTASGKTMCGGQNSSCVSTTFSSHGLQYSRVCGKIIGYQFASTDAFSPYIMQRQSIDSVFLDGIVLTHGIPRNHIWTFTTGYDQYETDIYSCPCNGDSYLGPIPPYVGNDYFCESGRSYNPPSHIYYISDPLWNGAGCVSGSCCTFNSPPWFCKNLATPTTDDIELRLCKDEDLNNEDVLFETLEFYVQ